MKADSLEILGYLRNRGIAIIQTNLDESEVQKAIPLAQDMFRGIKPEIAIVTLGSMSCTVETGFDAFSQRDVEKFIKERENNKAKH